MSQQIKYFSPAHQSWTKALFQRIQQHYGDNLISLAIFGSYARQENRLNSDLDLLIIVKKTKNTSRLALQRDFVHSIELPLEVKKEKLEQAGIHMEISNLILSKKQASSFMPIYLDMVKDCIFIVDQNNYLKEQLSWVRSKMKEWGSRKQNLSGHWYWEIRPGLRWGEKIDYDKR